MAFNDKLASLIAENNIRVEDLAKKIYCAKSTVYFWLAGEMTPSADALISIAKFFKVSTDYLLGLEDDFGIKIDFSAGTDPLSKDEKALVENFRHLNIYSRQAILVQVEALAEKETQKN